MSVTIYSPGSFPLILDALGKEGLVHLALIQCLHTPLCRGHLLSIRLAVTSYPVTVPLFNPLIILVTLA